MAQTTVSRGPHVVKPSSASFNRSSNVPANKPSTSSIQSFQRRGQITLGQANSLTRFRAQSTRSISRKTYRESRLSAQATSTSVQGEEYPTFPVGTAEREIDPSGLERLALKEEGWQYYDWEHKGNTHRVHYIQEGQSGSPVVLIHGFGAHAYHWRYTIPELAKKHRVYAICLLGYGWSDKAVISYSAETWATQVLEFCRSVVGTEEVTVVGNSIGGIAALSSASLMPSVKGVVLLNSAGDFEVEEEVPIDMEKVLATEPEAEKTLGERLKSAWGKVVTQGIFLGTKYRIGYFLKQVYANPQFVDEALVKSIFTPACDPDAPAAFFELSQAGQRTNFTLRGVLKQVAAPVMLLWGMQDPWVVPARADRIRELRPDATFVPLASAGHCPQDDAPAEVNASLLDFLEKV